MGYDNFCTKFVVWGSPFVGCKISVNYIGGYHKKDAENLFVVREKIMGKAVLLFQKVSGIKKIMHKGISSILDNFFVSLSKKLRRRHFLMFVSTFPCLLYTALACFKIISGKKLDNSL